MSVIPWAEDEAAAAADRREVERAERRASGASRQRQWESRAAHAEQERDAAAAAAVAATGYGLADVARHLIMCHIIP